MFKLHFASHYVYYPTYCRVFVHCTCLHLLALDMKSIHTPFAIHLFDILILDIRLAIAWMVISKHGFLYGKTYTNKLLLQTLFVPSFFFLQADVACSNKALEQEMGPAGLK